MKRTKKLLFTVKGTNLKTNNQGVVLPFKSSKSHGGVKKKKNPAFYTRSKPRRIRMYAVLSSSVLTYTLIPGWIHPLRDFPDYKRRILWVSVKLYNSKFIRLSDASSRSHNGAEALTLNRKLMEKLCLFLPLPVSLSFPCTRLSDLRLSCIFFLPSSGEGAKGHHQACLWVTNQE